MDETTAPTPTPDRPAQPGNGLAITALVLGVVGLIVPLVNIAALVCGIVGLKCRSRAMAIIGIVLGGWAS
jgi:hypothetical protein